MSLKISERMKANQVQQAKVQEQIDILNVQLNKLKTSHTSLQKVETKLQF